MYRLTLTLLASAALAVSAVAQTEGASNDQAKPAIPSNTFFKGKTGTNTSPASLSARKLPTRMGNRSGR
jgi:hypothetical protein